MTISDIGLEPGTVTVSEGGREYPVVSGEAVVPLGATVTITATPDNATGAFYEWDGALTGSTNPATLEVVDDASITAVFMLRRVLDVSVRGNGSVALDPAQPTEGYAPGTEITITATLGTAST